MTKVFIVSIREVHVQPHRIRADSKEEAIRKVQNCEGEVLENRMEYSHALDSEHWTVEEEEKEETP